MTTPGTPTPVRPFRADTGDARTILVTGAAGEVGHGLLAALQAAGHPVVAMDRREIDGAAASGCLATAAGDVTDAAFMESLVREHGVGTIIHLAALLSSSAERDPELAHAVNVDATVSLLSIAARQGERIGRPVVVLHPSSIAAYGFPDRATKDAAGTVGEDEHLEPITMYGCNKLACEHLGRYFARHYRQLDPTPGRGRVDFRGIRYPGLISGETVPTGGTSDYAPEMIHAAARGEPCTAFVDAEARIPFMTMGEAVEATLGLLDAPAERLTRSVYNVASFAPSAGEIREAVLEHFPGAVIDFARDERRAPIVDSWPADIDCSSARRDWGFSPRHDLRSALREELVPAIRRRYAATPEVAADSH